MKRVTQLSEIKTLLSEKGTTCWLCGQANLHYSGVIPENVDPSFPDRVEILCRDCSARRRKRPLQVYALQRFSEVAAEYLRLATILGEYVPNFDKSPSNSRKPSLVRDLPNVDRSAPPVPPRLDDADVARLLPDDPRLDPASAMFDDALYDRWLDT